MSNGRGAESAIVLEDPIDRIARIQRAEIEAERETREPVVKFPNDEFTYPTYRTIFGGRISRIYLEPKSARSLMSNYSPMRTTSQEDAALSNLRIATRSRQRLTRCTDLISRAGNSL